MDSIGKKRDGVDKKYEYAIFTQIDSLTLVLGCVVQCTRVIEY